MAQIIDPIPSRDSDKFLCCYVNPSTKIQIARITNVPDWYFERVVFPGQRLMFEATPQMLLEIHTGMMASAILTDTIPCHRLIIDEEPQPLINEESDSIEEIQDQTRTLRRAYQGELALLNEEVKDLEKGVIR